MRILFIVIIASFCGISLGAPDSWKPSPSEPSNAEDPRFKALWAYRRALVVVKVQTYLNEHQSIPGDKEDMLITDFQETVSAHEIGLATDFLKDYPDDQVAAELLLFQIKRTSGVWPPWKHLALALFDRCPDVIQHILPTLSMKERSKFLADVELGIRMSRGEGAVMSYSLPDERLSQIRSSISQLKQQNKP